MPEILFGQIEDSQEIQTLGDDPYTSLQLLNNIIRMLLGYGLYHCNFKEWGRKDAADKIWINLKLFIQEAYQCHLNATSNTTGQHGYVQNAFAAQEKLGDNNNNAAMVIMQMTALPTQSWLTTPSMAATTFSVTLAINQLAANQQAMMQQMMAYANTAWSPPPANTVPIAQFTIPAIGNFPLGGAAHGGRQGEPGQGEPETGPGQGGR
jgi:hypothetical protein